MFPVFISLTQLRAGAKEGAAWQEQPITVNAAAIRSMTSRRPGTLISYTGEGDLHQQYVKETQAEISQRIAEAIAALRELLLLPPRRLAGVA